MDRRQTKSFQNNETNIKQRNTFSLSRLFETIRNTHHTQLGAVILQEGQPIAFYSRKLAPAQTCYTTTKHELLAIVETLKEFRNILLGQ